MSVTSARKLQEYSRTVDQSARDALVVNHLWLVQGQRTLSPLSVKDVE